MVVVLSTYKIHSRMEHDYYYLYSLVLYRVSKDPALRILQSNIHHRKNNTTGDGDEGDNIWKENVYQNLTHTVPVGEL